MGDLFEYQDFQATHDHMPGKGKPMRVTGTVVFPTDGWTAKLEQIRPGISPFMLRLALVVKRPDPGAPVAEVLTPVPVEWSESGVDIEYTQVDFTMVDSDAPPPPVLDVEHPE